MCDKKSDEELIDIIIRRERDIENLTFLLKESRDEVGKLTLRNRSLINVIHRLEEDIRGYQADL